VVVDPGGEPRKILGYLKEKDLTVREIWLTHSHLDHCGGVKELKEKTGAVLFGHPVEKMLRAHVEEIERMYGLEGELENCPEPERYISGGEKLSFLEFSFDVLFTPGHSPGHLCFYEPTQGLLLAGDTLFAGSIGRTDLPGGDGPTLMKSIRDKILVLPPATVVMPGHGPDTTIEQESRSNPFVLSLS
jgi:hydroxyacylglutathione hydrolase